MLRNTLGAFQIGPLKSEVVKAGELKGGVLGWFSTPGGRRWENFEKKTFQGSLGNVLRNKNAKFQTDTSKIDGVKTEKLKAK